MAELAYVVTAVFAVYGSGLLLARHRRAGCSSSGHHAPRLGARPG